MTFSVPVVIKLPYKAAAMKQARVADPVELEVFYYDTSILSWVTVEIESVDTLNQLMSIKTSHFSMYTIGASVADAAADGGGGGGSCFISAVQRAEATFFITDWPVSSLTGLLALIGFMCLGRRKEIEGEKVGR